MLVRFEKLRWLAWLRVTMFVRGLTRRPRLLFGVALMTIVLVFLEGRLDFFLYGALTTTWLTPIGQSELLYPLLTAVSILWLLLPLLSYTSNEGLDVTKLQLFPLTRLEMMFGLFFSSFFGLGTVVLMLLFALLVVALGVHSLVAGLLAALVLLVFYLALVSITQLVLALLMSTLQSRRFRDLSILVLLLGTSSCYLFSRFAISAFNLDQLRTILNRGGFSPYMQWLPSGIAAGALRAALQGNWGASLGLLVVLMLIAVVAASLWNLVLARNLSASESGATRRARQAVLLAPAALPASSLALAATTTSLLAAPGVPSSRTSVSGEGGPALTAQTCVVYPRGVLWEQLGTLLYKELICFWRDPLLKVLILQRLVYLAMVVFLNLTSNHKGLSPLGLSLLTLLLIFFFILSLSSNTLGIERQSLTTLLLFPVNRFRLLWGKNLAVGLMGLVILLVIVGLNAILSGLQMALATLIIGLAGFGVALGVANVIAVNFPRYQPELGRRSQAGAGNSGQPGGCLNTAMALVGVLASLILVSPVVFSVGLPYLFKLPLIWLATMPLSLAYSVGLYIVLTGFSVRCLLKQEPEILAMTTRAQ